MIITPDYVDSSEKDSTDAFIKVPRSKGASQVKIQCPACGSPYVVTYELLDLRSREIPNFECVAGGCKYQGSVYK